MLLSLLMACHPAAEDPGTRAQDPPVPTPDFNLTLVQEWLQTDLPMGPLDPGVQPGISLGDLDGDGWLDALMAYPGGSVVLRNDQTGHLVIDPAFTMDGGAFPAAEAIALADLDGDGDLDGELGRWGAEDLLLWNDGSGHFSSEPLPGSEGSTFSAAFADLDGDGDLDLAISAGSSTLSVDEILAGGESGDPNLVYRNDAGHFVNVPDALPTVGINGITFQLAPVDADADGDMDLYSANDAGPYVETNHLLLNDGSGHFSDSGDAGATQKMFAMGAAMGDANQDGWVDMYLTNVGPPRMLLNLGDGSFAEAAEATGTAIPPMPESLISWGTAFVDFDADRDQDLIVSFGRGGDEKKIDAVDPTYVQAESQPNQILVSDGVDHFEHVELPSFMDPGPTRAVAVGDLDQDGRPDLVTAGKHFLRQWHAEGGFDPGITLVLHGPPANSQGIGARIVVEVDGVSRTTWALPATTGSSSAAEWYLGLGDKKKADRLTIVWPDGATSELEDVAAGRVDVDHP